MRLFVARFLFNVPPIDVTRPDLIRLKVGRTNDMVRRYGEHQRHCPLLRLTLVGYYPSGGESAQDLASGRLRPSGRTSSSHLLERVVHRELTSVAIHAPYLSPGGTVGGLFLGATQFRVPCPSCKGIVFYIAYLLNILQAALYTKRFLLLEDCPG